MLSIVVEKGEQAVLEQDLDALVREGARRMLVSALKVEVDEYIATHAGERDESGKAMVVRNGVAEPRRVTTTAGELEIRSPRVNDRRQGSRFMSAILPPWARRSPKVSEVLPVLYLRGISTKDFVPALAEFFGVDPIRWTPQHLGPQVPMKEVFRADEVYQAVSAGVPDRGGPVGS